jgi:hypothetical protein
MRRRTSELRGIRKEDQGVTVCLLREMFKKVPKDSFQEIGLFYPGQISNVGKLNVTSRRDNRSRVAGQLRQDEDHAHHARPAWVSAVSQAVPGWCFAAAFLRRNIPTVPCIHLEVQDSQHMGHLQPSMFRQEILLGEHLPRLRDFWDDAVSCDSFYPAKRRVFLIEMREMQVPR